MSEESAVRHVKFNIQTLIEILNTFNIKVTANDIKGYNLEKLIEIYKAFLKTCLNVDEATLEKHPYDIVSALSEDMLTYQKNTFKKLQLYTLIFHLYEMCGLKGHCSEIFFPYLHGKNLFHKQLSVLVSFARFEYIHLEDFVSIQSDYKIKSKEVAEIQNKSAWYKSQIFTLKQDREERKIPIENSKKRIQALNEKLNQFKLINKKIDDDTEKIDKELTKATNDKEELMTRITTSQKRSQFLEKMLIKSPEKLRADIDKNKNKIKDMELLIQTKKDENEKMANMYAEREKFLDGFKFIMESFENFYLNVQEANKMSKEIETDKEQIINMELEAEQFNSKIITKSKDKEKKEKDYEAYRESVEREMMALNTKDQSYEAQMSKIEARIKCLEKALNESKSEMKVSREHFKSQMDKEVKAFEAIEIQHDGIEVKRRILNDVQNQILSNLSKCVERELFPYTQEEEALNEILKHTKI